ncbi:MAG: glycoside hydrolase family 3 C-terminal domain-containing protein [Candidatus Howiella sp.]|jgi:beta-glucosidase-like glycosyl hydrolase
MKHFKKAIALLLTAVLGGSMLLSPAPLTAAGLSAEGNIELSRQAATEGMVLLKNEKSSLPLSKGETVSIFGKGQIDFIKGGGGSGDVVVEYVRNLLEGMEIKEEEGKIQINQTVADRYRRNSGYMPTQAEMETAAGVSKTAVIVISRHSGEGYDRTAAKGDYYLTDDEEKLIQMAGDALFRNVVVVLNVGGMVDTSWIEKYSCVKSVLLAWQPGMEGGLAVADILTGDVTPSGKLSDTFAKDFSDYPEFYDSDFYVNYTEDVYVGYRWFETFDPNYERVNYEFGYGLSYTEFSVSDVSVAEKDGQLVVSARVTNTGSRYSGKEVVQVYFSAPQGKLGKPGKELAGFAKTELLAPGKSQTVEIAFDIDDMSSYDDTGKVQKSAYVMEAGDYQIYVGNSVRNAGENGVRYTYTVAKDTVTEQLSQQLEPIQLEKRLLADGSYETLETFETMEDIGTPVSSTGTTKIEAEDLFFKHYHAKVYYNDAATICGLETLTSDTNVNRWASYIIDVETAGKYALGLAIGNGGSGVQNSIAVYIDDAKQSGISLNFPNTGGKWNIKEVGSVTVDLPAGKHILKIEFLNGDNFQGVMDYFTLTPGEGSGGQESETHTISASGQNKIEGEAFAACDSRLGTETIAAGADQGGICVYGFDQNGTYLDYNLDVAQAGTYSLSFHASNGYGTDHNDSLQVLVGGVDQNVTVNLPNTATSDNQWYNFVDTDPVTVTLSAGKTTLRLVSKGFGNVDCLTLTRIVPVTQSLETAAPQAGKTILLSDVQENPDLMDAFLDQLTDEEVIYLLEGHGASIPEGTGCIGNLPDYGIPAAETADGGTGIRLSEPCTAWPIATLLACTWDVDLLEKVGAAIAVEAVENGADVWLAPGMNIHRNPLCGRNFEYYSEDPLLAGTLTAAITRGVQSGGVGVTIKHFAANNKETNRGYQDSRMSERALREIYLKSFEICIEKGNPWCIMSSYNHINGAETSESYDLLTNILREEWGFDGLVMSDWWNDSIASREVLAGNNIKMATGEPAHLLGALKMGHITREDLEKNAVYVLELVMKSNAMKRAVLDPKSTTVTASGATRIKATDFTWKHASVGMEACEDTDGGYNPTDTYEGRWLEYYLDVEEGGVYRFRARVASNGDRVKIGLLGDGLSLTTLDESMSTGGWQKWATTGDIFVTLPAGRTALRLDFQSGGVNLNWIELERYTDGAQVSITASADSAKLGDAVRLSAEITGGTADLVWSLAGNESSGTSVSSDGVLTVAEDETAESVIIYAASPADSKIASAVRITIGEDVKPGDVDGDGSVTVSDVVELRKLIVAGSHTDRELAAGNLDDTDSTLTVSDVVALRALIVSGVFD